MAAVCIEDAATDADARRMYADRWVAAVEPVFPGSALPGQPAPVCAVCGDSLV